MGQQVDRTDAFYSLSSTARGFQGTNMNDMDKISAPHGTTLPIIGTNELFIRKAYRDLYDEILKTFERVQRVVVTGTSGIGKSAFLVYLAIRILAESNDNEPPIIIFHTKRTAECYGFGGCSTLRSGTIGEFEPFLNLRDTWYFVASSPDPILDRAKTVISASPMTLLSGDRQYKYVDRDVAWHYYMAPWTLDELKNCWANLVSFHVIPFKDMEDIYLKIGGVPRYVLEVPMKVLNLRLTDIEGAKDIACEHLDQALDRVRDPMMLMRFSSHWKDTLGFSCRLIHRWPTDGHRSFRLEWASTYVAEKFADSLDQDVCTEMLKMLIRDLKVRAIGITVEEASSIMFEAYILRSFREGGHTFEIKNLETGESGRLEILQNPDIKHFSTIPSVPVPTGTLYIPADSNNACADMLLSPRDLFLITMSENHPINGPQLLKFLNNLVQAHWIPPGEPRLIFVVPSQVYANFGKQKYLTSEGEAWKTVPEDLQRVKQYVLKIDLESAAAGNSPGLQAPIQ